MAQNYQAQFQRKTSVSLVFNEQEINNFYKLLVDGPLLSCLPSEQSYSTRFTALEDFIVETRRISPCVAEFKNIDLRERGDENTIRMITWLTHVAPSCVYRYRRADFGQTGFYACCFQNCHTLVSSQFTLIRHYRTQHYNRIPVGIFGAIILHKCYPCKLEFKRVHLLNQHLMSPIHIKRMCMLGKNSLIIFNLNVHVSFLLFLKVSTLVADI